MKPGLQALTVSALVMLGGFPVSAEGTSPNPILTLEAAIAQAQATSPTSAAAAAGVQAANAQRRIASLRPNPSFEAMTENVGGTGVYSGLRASETTAGLSLPLELGGKRSARLGVAQAQGGRALLDTFVSAADLRLQVSRAYTDAGAAQERVRTSRDQVAIAAEGLRVARVRVKAGRASPLEEQRADVARMNAEGDAERAQRTADVTLANLGNLVGTPVGAVDQTWFLQIATMGPVRPVDVASTLTVATAQADVSTAEAQVRLARSQQTPDVTVSASARRIEATNDMASVFGVSVPLPLFNNGRAAVDLASAQRSRSDALQRGAALSAQREIANAQTDLANALTSARNASGPALATAAEAARIARIGYREGKFGQLDLLEAERTLAQTRAASIDALAAYHAAQALLTRLTTAAPDSARPNQ